MRNKKMIQHEFTDTPRKRAADLHRTRRIEADRLFIEQHGEYAAISRSGAG